MDSISAAGAANYSAVQVPASVAGSNTNQVSDVGFAERMERLKSLNAKEAEKMGKEFESVFVSMLLKEMRNTLDQGEGGLFGSEQSDTFGGMFDQFMGEHLADSSPLGIADAIKSYLNNKPVGS